MQARRAIQKKPLVHTISQFLIINSLVFCLLIMLMYSLKFSKLSNFKRTFGILKFSQKSNERIPFHYYDELLKGQIISKGHLIFWNSPKKQTKEFIFTTTTNLFVHFLGEFEIIWPLAVFLQLQIWIVNYYVKT